MLTHGIDQMKKKKRKKYHTVATVAKQIAETETKSTL